MPSPSRHLAAAMLAGLVTALWSPPASAQAVGRDSVTLVPDSTYRAGGLHRFFFGTRYRDLWAVPVRVPILDIGRFAGGLKPTGKGGGQQTRSLRFVGGDGREYAFRALVKNPSVVLPPELRETFAASLLKDQMSSGHPAGPLVVSPLLDAAGVLHATPILVQLPDSPVLGEYRAEFAGLLGMIEERPRGMGDEESTFAGASAIVSTDELLKELDKEPEVRVDARAFLLARLTDVFLGDWDRHQDQWRWARVSRTGAPAQWQPIPRDRDQAFVRFDGFLLSQARRSAPQLLNFGPSYGGISGATWNGRDLDRRFLTGLERPVWDSIAALLKGRLTDQAIAGAVRHLPPEFQPLEAARLESTLRARRDRLDEAAGKYYRLLAHEVDVYGTDKADDATVTRQQDGTTLVTLSNKGAEYFRRRFHPGETREIRLHLQGAGDHVVVDGAGKSHPTIRAIGGGGDDRYDIRRGGGVKLYDDRGDNTATGAGLNRKAWTWKPDSLRPRDLPPRDWGRRTQLLLNLGYGPDVQVLVGYKGHTDWYGFRRVPYATRVDYSILYATGEQTVRGNLGVTRQFENSRGYVGLDLFGSGMETLRWYGFGNETEQSAKPPFYRVNQNQLAVSAVLGMRFGKRGTFSVGPVVRWSDTDLGEQHNRERFIKTDAPYGVGEFGMVGARAALIVDTRDHPAFATRGVALSLEAAAYPKAWDAVETVTRMSAQASFALAPSGRWRPSLNVMGGAVKTTGQLPFFLAPTLGGLHTLRGYRPDRFAGDAALYGSVEARVPLTRIKFVVPGEQGFFAFADGGRVYLDGETSDKWHSSLGGGVWLTFLSRDNVVFAGAGAPTRDKEGTRFILGFGFPF